MALRSEEEMAVKESSTPILADPADVAGVADVRNVPLARLSGDADAADLVHMVMASAAGPSLVVVAGFNSAV
jgi:hypothetical protein